MSGVDLLVISPRFHGYDQSIAAAFTQLGLRVRTVSDQPPRGLVTGVRTKLLHELPERRGRDTTAHRRRAGTGRLLDALRESRPDRVLVVKGDLVAPEVWSELDALAVPTVLWLYDELRRTRWEDERLSVPGAVASYSEQDVAALVARGVPATHVPLGHDHLTPVPRREISPEVSLIGARYPRRVQAVERLRDAGVPVRAYGRAWSHDIRDRLRTWGERRPDLPSGRDLERPEAYAVMRSGLATLNIHGDQDGFTMRTFEAAGVGAVQLCDREDVSRFYEPGTEVLVHRHPEDAVEQCRRLAADPRRAEGLRRAAVRRTVAEHTLVHRARALAELW